MKFVNLLPDPISVATRGDKMARTASAPGGEFGGYNLPNTTREYREELNGFITRQLTDLILYRQPGNPASHILLQAFPGAENIWFQEDKILFDIIYNVISVWKNRTVDPLSTKDADTEQCKAAGLHPDALLTPELQVCYLCGERLFTKSECEAMTNPPCKPRNIKKSLGGSCVLYPECEHVLPFVMGATLLELAPKYNKGSVSNERIKLEYKWAHTACNSIKNQGSFIKTDTYDIVLDENQVRGFKESLINEQSTYSIDFIREMTIRNNWNATQIAEMKARIMAHTGINDTIGAIIGYYNLNFTTAGKLEAWIRYVCIISLLKYWNAMRKSTPQLFPPNTLAPPPLNTNTVPDAFDQPSIEFVRNIWIEYFKQYVIYQQSGPLGDFIDAAATDLRFGKKKPKVKRLKNKALMTKLKSVGIKITKKQGKRRVYLSRPELIKRATAFRNLQLRAKKLKVRIMYKNKKGKYVYKTAKRLMNDIKRQMKKPVKKRTKKPVKKQMKKSAKKPNAKQMKQRFG